MKQLLDDLLDYSRASLELGISISPSLSDLSHACEEEIELQQVAWPSNTVVFTSTGTTRGVWDTSRLKQVLGNLIANAAKYGTPGSAIGVRLIGVDNEVTLSVENDGPTLAAKELQLLFEPLRRGGHKNVEAADTSLGLGLFIVRQIVHAHVGTVSASSIDGKTVFSVTLPRNPST